MSGTRVPFVMKLRFVQVGKTNKSGSTNLKTRKTWGWHNGIWHNYQLTFLVSSQGELSRGNRKLSIWFYTKKSTLVSVFLARSDGEVYDKGKETPWDAYWELCAILDTSVTLT